VDEKEQELLRRIAESNEKILFLLSQPKSRIQRIIDFLLAAIGIGGGISIADALINLIGR
jgi:hypothetical protein